MEAMPVIGPRSGAGAKGEFEFWYELGISSLRAK